MLKPRRGADLAHEPLGSQSASELGVQDLESHRALVLRSRARYTIACIRSPAGITTADQLHPSVCTVQSMRAVVVEYGERRKPRVSVVTTRPAAGETVGLLPRRHVRPSWIQHIGKEANGLRMSSGVMSRSGMRCSSASTAGQGRVGGRGTADAEGSGSCAGGRRLGPQPPSGLSDTSVEAPTSAKEPAHSHQGSACLPGDQVRLRCATPDRSAGAFPGGPAACAG